MNKNQIFIKSGTEYKKITKELLTASNLAELIGDRNKMVGIKPNLVSPSDPSEGGTTHPEIVAGILEYLKEHDDSFYRVEKTYHDFSATGDSLLQNYAPVSMYCSTMSGSLKTFYEKMYPTEEYRYIKHDLDGALYDDAFAITNTKYILSWTKLDWDYLEEIYEYDGTYVYRNLHAGSIASLVYNE